MSAALDLPRLIPSGIRRRPRARLTRQAARDGLGSLVVKTHAIDDGLLRWITKRPRTRISLLRQGSDRADLHMAKTKRRRRPPGAGVFVETGRQTHGIGKRQAKGFDRPRVLRRQTVQNLKSPAKQRKGTQPGHRSRADLMGALGIETEKCRTDDLLVKDVHLGDSGTSRGEIKDRPPANPGSHAAFSEVNEAAFLCLFFAPPLARCAHFYRP